jgi:hypothetical protein
MLSSASFKASPTSAKGQPAKEWDEESFFGRGGQRKRLKWLIPAKEIQGNQSFFL